MNEKAALNNRKNILVAIGNRLDALIQPNGFREDSDETLINRMGFVMEGLFADAYDSDGLRAGIEPGFENLAGAVLAQELVRDSVSTTNPTSIRVQVFAATLLDVVTEAIPGITNDTEQRALATAVMELAKTYAWLTPNAEANVPADKQKFGFLDLLWQLQIPHLNSATQQLEFKDATAISDALSSSVTALKDLLTGVTEPVRAIQFINNLLQAASDAASIKMDVRDARFVRELMEFGIEFVKSNPTVNTSFTGANVQGFLDRLWRGDLQQKKQILGGLNAFFSGMDTKDERIKGLDFAVNLLDVAELLQGQGLEIQKKDPVFLDALIGLGGAYAALEPQAPIEDTEDLKLFLNTLWQAQDFQKGAEELKSFLIDFNSPDNRSSLLRFQQGNLHALRQVSGLEEDLSDVSFVNAMLTSGSTYVYTQLNPSADLVFNDQLGFFESIWSAQNGQTNSRNAVSILSNLVARIPYEYYDPTWKVASASTAASKPFAFPVTKSRYDTFLRAEGLDLDDANNPLTGSAHNNRAGDIFERFVASNLGLQLNENPTSRFTATREGINFDPDVIGTIVDSYWVNGVKVSETPYQASELFEIKATKEPLDTSDPQLLGYISYLGHDSILARVQRSAPLSKRLLPVLNLVTTTDPKPRTRIISNQLVVVASVNGVVVNHSVLLTNQKVGTPSNPQTARYLKLSDFRLLNPLMVGRYPDKKIVPGVSGSLIRPRG